MLAPLALGRARRCLVGVNLFSSPRSAIPYPDTVRCPSRASGTHGRCRAQEITVWCFRPPLALGSGRVGHRPPRAQGSIPSRLQSRFPGRPSCISSDRTRSLHSLYVYSPHHHRVLERHSSFPAAAVDVSYPYCCVPLFPFRARCLPSFRLVPDHRQGRDPQKRRGLVTESTIVEFWVHYYTFRSPALR